MKVDAVALEVWNNLFAQVAEEMGAALGRSALSPNIKERRDRSCAVFDGKGRLIAQAAHIPVHLGSTPLSVRAAIAAVPMNDGDVVILNDPFAGGTHLPDVTLVAPFDTTDAGDDNGQVVRFYLANRAHHADVGGSAPGSFAVGVRATGTALPRAIDPEVAMGPKYRMARGNVPHLVDDAMQQTRTTLTIDDEGVRVPPMLLTDEVAAWFASQSRTPLERAGDLAAQKASLEVGRRRLSDLCARHGAKVVAAQAASLRAYAGRIMRKAIAAIPDGAFAFADSLDDDGAGTEDVAVRVRITISGEQATVDFSDSDDESPGALNAVLPVTLSAVLYCFRLLCPDDTPTNEGLLDPIEVIAPAGTIVNARPPRAVAAGNVETSQRIVDVVLGALARALPDRIPAASAGTMSNLMFGGVTPSGDPFAYYETIPGGAGGGPAGPGARAVQTHMTNTWSTPVEALEHALPVRVVRSAVRHGSGGLGRFAGGDGVEREIEFLSSATVTLVGERRRRPPYGLLGGGPGALGEDSVVRAGEEVRIPAKCTFDAQPGDHLIIRTPGGGGWGDPRKA